MSLWNIDLDLPSDGSLIDQKQQDHCIDKKIDIKFSQLRICEKFTEKQTLLPFHAKFSHLGCTTMLYTTFRPRKLKKENQSISQHFQ